MSARLDHPGGDQHAFEKPVRVGFEEIAVLEGAGLAFVAVDREQPRHRLLPHQPPFAPGRKAGAAEPAQTGVLERFDQLIAGAIPGEAGLQEPVSAGGAIGVESDKGQGRRMRVAGGDGGRDRGEGRVLVQGVPDRRDRCLVAAAHARRANHPHPIAEPISQTGQQGWRAGQLAAEAVADPYRQRRRRRFVIHDDVEMSVERGDLVDLDQRQPHLLGQCRQMAGMQAAEMVLQQMQMLDQQVAAALAEPEQCLHLGERRRIDLPPLRMVETPPPTRTRVNAPVVPR